MKLQDKPIGILDSGVGGLTVASEIIEVLPHENIIYLGDTARVPYGTRSRRVITQFALELTHFLVNKKAKCLVVACNTISSTALEAVKKVSPVPVFGVIDQTVKEALKISKSKRLGVIATMGTINSGAYQRLITGLHPAAKVFTRACSLFVPLAEEGMTTGPAVEKVAGGYLLALKKAKIDTLILGCTHFPLLRGVIAKTMGSEIKLVESGGPTAKHLQEILLKKGLSRKSGKPEYQFFFTDAPDQVAAVAKNFFGRPLPGKIVKIDL